MLMKGSKGCYKRTMATCHQLARLTKGTENLTLNRNGAYKEARGVLTNGKKKQFLKLT